MKLKKLEGTSVVELKKALVEATQERFNLCVAKATGALQDTSKVKTVRRNIARLKTMITKVALGESQ